MVRVMLLTALFAFALQASQSGLGPQGGLVPEPKPVDVYILTGQSNSLGTTNLEGSNPNTYGPGAHAADPQPRLFWSNVRSTNSVYPPVLYGDSGGAQTQLQMQQGDGGGNPAFWGPEFGFARAIRGLDRNGNEILIIKASRGGGGNTLWHKPSFESNQNAGHMWGHLRDTIDDALLALTNESRSFRIRGLLYLQGESNNSGEAAIAGVRLNALFTDLKAHIESAYPGTTGPVQVVVGEIAASTSSPNRELTTLKQMELAAVRPNIAFVRTADLALKGDNIHFGKDAKLSIGSRIAETFAGSPQAFKIGAYDAAESAPEFAIDVKSPTDFGFVESGSGPGVTLAGVIVGMKPAWRIYDNSSAANPGYLRSLNAVDYQGMFSSGWSFRADIKVIAGGGLALWSVTPGKDPGWGVAGGAGNMNGFIFDRVGSNELQIALWGMPVPPVLLGPGSADEFHTAELRGSANSPLFDFYVDELLIAAGINLTSNPGLAGFADRVLFNSGQTTGTGRDVLWAELSLSSKPMLLGGI